MNAKQVSSADAIYRLTGTLPRPWAYRGCLISPVGLGASSGLMVSKGGFTICYPRTLDEAKAAIDGLLDP